MTDVALDAVDRAILSALCEDARYNTNAAISDRVDVSASTVGKRISRLEDCGVVTAHRSVIDYERAGFHLHTLFVCTAPISDREALAERALDLDAVVGVRELMTGRENVHVEAIGASRDDITHTARALDEMGYAISDEILIRADHSRAPSADAVASDE